MSNRHNQILRIRHKHDQCASKQNQKQKQKPKLLTYSQNTQNVRYNLMFFCICRAAAMLQAISQQLSRRLISRRIPNRLLEKQNISYAMTTPLITTKHKFEQIIHTNCKSKPRLCLVFLPLLASTVHCVANASTSTQNLAASNQKSNMSNESEVSFYQSKFICLVVC